MANADRIIELLHEAKTRPAGAERARFLDEACGDDAALKEQIVSLLKADANEGDSDFLKNTLLLRPTAPVTEKPGDRIGRYKLLEQIGEGGCGVVYMAEQEEPVRRRVALKVIKLGMDTKQVIARFEAERQALAMMDHPNIAKVLDGGATDTGRPFFVMELVRGIKITDYCDQNNLSTKERLELFMEVCQAIQHAHQKGIIHRDIKPSNILVNQHDDVTVPKVIDFGIAKATIGNLTDKTLFTAFAQFMGTPAYMSPEQAQMSGLDIDTRADIYSLGVLLYELLTGNTPFDAKELLAAGIDEMRRKIREDEPAKPSTCLSTMQAMDLTTVARRRHVEPPKLIHLIRGDLDWLVMKCLEKDRTRRYETANGLAMDIQRHLNNEPVTACPPSRLYEFQKTVQRHKFGFAAAAALIVVLAVGVLASSWQAIRATRAEREQTRLRQQSETEAAKATAISDFLQQLLRSANPDALKGSDYTVRQLLDDFSAGLANQLKDQPEVEAAVRATIGRAYYRLGVADKAQAQHERALTLRRRIFGDQSEQVAESLVDFTWTFFEKGPFEQGEYAKGEPYVREALDIYRKRGTVGQPVISALWALQKLLSAQARFAEVDAVTQEALVIAGKSPGVEFQELASMIHGLAEAKIGQAKYAEAESLALEAVAMQRRLRGAEHPETAWALYDLGLALIGQQKLTEAEAALREALRIFRKQYSSAHKSVEHTTYRLKLVLEARGDSAALEALAREGFTDANKRIKRNDADAEAWIERALGHADLKLWKAATADSAEAIARSRDAKLTTRAALGANCLVLAQRAFAAAQYEAAERASQQAITLFKQLVQENPQEIGYPQHLGHSQWVFGQALQNTSRPDQAEKVYLEALQVFEKAARDFPAAYFFRQEQAFSRRFLGELVNALGRVDDAERHYRAAIALYAALAADVPQNTFYAQEEAYTTWLLAGILERASRPDAAAIESRQVIALYVYEKAILNFPNNAAFKSSLIELLRGQGKLADAEPVLREALARQRKLVGSEHPDVANALHKLGDLLRDSDQGTKAEAVFREALEIRRKLFGNERMEVAHSLYALAWVLNHNGKRDEAVALSREGLALRRKLLGNDDPEVGYALHDLAGFLRDQGKLADAESTVREALAIRRKRLSNDHPDVAASFNLLSDLLRAEGKLAEVEALYREELAMRRKLLGNEHRSVEASLAALAKVLQQEGKLAEAEAVWREELAVERRLSGDEHLFVANSLQSFAAVLRDSGKWSEAEALFREALGMRRKLLGNENPAVATSLSWLGVTLSDQGKHADAEAMHREALQIRRKIPAEEQSGVAYSLNHVGYALRLQGKHAEAEAVYRELLALRRKLSADDPQLAAALAELTQALLVQQKFAEAEPPARECLTIREKKFPDDWLTFNARSMLGGSLLGQKKYAEAEPLLLSAYGGMKQREDKIPATSKPRLKESLQRLVKLYEATGQSEKATEWNKKLTELDKAETGKKTAIPKP